MNIFIPLGIILAFLCLFTRKSPKQVEYMFAFSMLAVFVFAALRYEFGPDYAAYQAAYEGLQGTTAQDYTGTGSSQELGFLIYLSVFQNFTTFIITNAIFWVFANYLFLRKYVDGEYYWIAILYMFFTSTYLKLNMVAMRSAMVAFIFIYAFFFLVKDGIKNKIIFAALIILAGQFHTTGLILVLFAFLNSKNRSIIFNKYFIGVIAFIGFISFFIGGNYLLQYLSMYLMDSIDSFSKYAEEENANIGAASLSFNTIIFELMSIATAFYLAWAGRQEQNKEYVFVYKIAVLAALVQVIFRQSMIGDRYFMCFNPCYIAALLHSLKKGSREIGLVVMLFVTVSSLYIFNSKLHKSYNRYFETYHTIFEAPRIP